MKVRVRLCGDSRLECERLRKHFLKKHPQLIMAKPRQGSNPKYSGKQKWFSYGDYEFGTIRRRRND